MMSYVADMFDIIKSVGCKVGKNIASFKKKTLLVPSKCRQYIREMINFQVFIS